MKDGKGGVRTWLVCGPCERQRLMVLKSARRKRRDPETGLTYAALERTPKEARGKPRLHVDRLEALSIRLQRKAFLSEQGNARRWGGYHSAYAQKYWAPILAHRTNKSEKTNYYFSKLLRTRVCNVLQGIRKSRPTLDMLGCSLAQLRTHLESQFRDGMTWENYGTHWHIDHIRPCASFDLRNETEQWQCFHYTNLQPLTAEENWAKNSHFNGKRWANPAKYAQVPMVERVRRLP